MPANLWLARSDDGGESFEGPWEVAGNLAFQPRVVVHPEGDVSITSVQASDVAVLQFVGPVEVRAVHSGDGGETFSDPVAVSGDDRPRLGVPAPAIDAEGNLVVVYQDFKDNVRDFQNLEGPPWTEPAALVFAWSDARHADEDVFVRRSTDGASESFDSRSGTSAAGHLDVDFGTGMGLVSDRGAALVAWTDTRLARDPEHGRQDIFAARVGLPGVGGNRTSALVAIVALLAGLACVGSGLWLDRRSRPGGRR